MKTVAFINEKGGTCKTTLAVNTAAYYALKRKKRVLLIDLDSQGHAGKSLGLSVHDLPLTTFDIMARPSLDPAKAINETRIKNLDIICSNKSLADFPISAARHKDRDLRLQRAVTALGKGKYHYAFIDAPPSMSLITNNILVASTDVVVPVALTYLALDGCAEIVRSIHSIRGRFPSAKPVLGMVIPTMYRKTRLANEIVSKLAQYFPDKISKTVLGFNVRIDEAQSYGKTIWEYEPKGRGSLMLESLSIELYNKVLRK